MNLSIWMGKDDRNHGNLVTWQRWVFAFQIVVLLKLTCLMLFIPKINQNTVTNLCIIYVSPASSYFLFKCLFCWLSAFVCPYVPFRTSASDCVVSTWILKRDVRGILTFRQAQGQETLVSPLNKRSLLYAHDCWFLVCLLYWPWHVSLCCFISFQAKPHQALVDLQSHAGRDQSHLPGRTVPGRHVPHHQGRRCRFLEEIFRRKVKAFFLVFRHVCQIRSALSRLSLELQSIKSL